MTNRAKFRALSVTAFGAYLLCSTGAFADPVPFPAMSGPLAANANPTTFNLDVPGLEGFFGNVHVTGAFTAYASVQDQERNFPGDRSVNTDITNAQVVVSKSDGWFQYSLQAGEYAFPALGTPFARSRATPGFTFGSLPQAYAKVVLTDEISVNAGKLPTLIGNEYTFTFENMNIERGLLWGQEPAVSRGAQINYSSGAFNASVSVNDGYYTNRFNWISGLLSYGFNGGADTLAFSAGGNLGKTAFAAAVQNNGYIFNLIYTHTSGPWTFSPYIQYNVVPRDPTLGLTNGASSFGGAMLANYKFDDHWNLSGRFEYIDTSGKTGAANLLYGRGSNAFSATITPTWQYKILFVRGEVSYVSAGSVTAGSALGPLGNAKNQFRGMLESGILF